jgi:hypothetical protein
MLTVGGSPVGNINCKSNILLTASGDWHSNTVRAVKGPEKWKTTVPEASPTSRSKVRGSRIEI